MTILYHTIPSTKLLDQRFKMSKYWDRNGLPLQATYKDFLFGTYGGGTLRNARAKRVMIPAPGTHDNHQHLSSLPSLDVVADKLFRRPRNFGLKKMPRMPPTPRPRRMPQMQRQKPPKKPKKRKRPRKLRKTRKPTKPRKPTKTRKLRKLRKLRKPRKPRKPRLRKKPPHGPISKTRLSST